jgi:hypothetical protein
VPFDRELPSGLSLRVEDRAEWLSDELNWLSAVSVQLSVLINFFKIFSIMSYELFTLHGALCLCAFSLSAFHFSQVTGHESRAPGHLLKQRQLIFLPLPRLKDFYDAVLPVIAGAYVNVAHADSFERFSEQAVARIFKL